MTIEEIAERIKKIERRRGKRPSKKKLFEAATSVIATSEIVVDLAETKVKEGNLGVIHLLGIAHEVQWDKTNLLTKKFKSYLIEQVNKLKITLLAEEWSDNACDINHIDKSTVKETANELGIEHRYCDMSVKERKLHDIYTEGELIVRSKVEGTEDEIKLKRTLLKSYKKREQYWFDQIKDIVKIHNTIFACGSQHLGSFESLLKQNGLNVTVFTTRFDDPKLDDKKYAN